MTRDDGAAPAAAPRLRVYRIPHSTNVVRVALAAALKGIPLELVDVPADDRSELVRISGQPLVPVLVVGDGEPGEPGTEVLFDSPRILAWLEETWPEPALLPDDPHEQAAVFVLCDWFNRVWKRPPNLIDAERAKAAAGEPVDEAAIAAWGDDLGDALVVFEGLLSRPGGFLFGDQPTLADVTAWPFLLYAALPVPADDEAPFHHILAEFMPLGEGFPLLRAWIERMAELPAGQAALAARA